MSVFSAHFATCEGMKPGTCPDALEWGFRVVLFFSGLAFVMIFSVWLLTFCEVRRLRLFKIFGSLDGPDAPDQRLIQEPRSLARQA